MCVFCFFCVCVYLARAPAALKLGTLASRSLIYFLYTCLKPYKTYKSIKSVVVGYQYTNLCAKLQFMFNKKIDGVFFDCLLIATSIHLYETK